MDKNQGLLARLFLILFLYLGIKHLIPGGSAILYPVNLFVTFLHEFGHAVGALATGGGVENIQINSNGSGYCVTLGGNRAITLMGGYIGSAIFGNMLLYIGAKLPKMADVTMYVLSAAMLFTAFFWFTTPSSTMMLVGFAVVFVLLARLTGFSGEILMFLGLASIIHIIEDFNVGPTSDLQKYAELFHVIPMQVWMYAWLVIVVVLFVINLRWILRLR